MGYKRYFQAGYIGWRSIMVIEFGRRGPANFPAGLWILSPWDESLVASSRPRRNFRSPFRERSTRNGFPLPR